MLGHGELGLQEIFAEQFLQAPIAVAETRTVNASILSTMVFLVLGGRQPSDSRVLPALASEFGDAWVTLHEGSPWVCWSELELDCWRRIELEPLPATRDPAFVPEEDLDMFDTLDMSRPSADPTQGVDVRFGFEPGRLWIAVDDQLWVIEPDQRQARVLDSPAGAVTLIRPTSPRCGPRARVPAASAGRITFVAADRCPHAWLSSGCLRPRPRVRRPSGVELRAGLTLGYARSWALTAAQPDLGIAAGLQARAGVELLAVIELGFDGPAALRLARSRAELLARDRRRAIPPVVEGPLAEVELDALRTVACSEAA